MEKVYEVAHNGSDSNAQSLAIGICELVLFPVGLVILFLMLFVYKTYKTTFQRLIVYYIVLSLWFDLSAAILIVGDITEVDGRWACNILRYLNISSQFAWYTYVTVIANFSLFLTIYLTRVRLGKVLSKRSNKCMECTCVTLAVVTGLTMASVVEIYNHTLNLECSLVSANRFPSKFWIIYSSLYLGMDLEVILVSFSSCILFCFICQRIHNRRTAVLLRNSVINVAVNASVMGLDSVRMGYYIYEWSAFAQYRPTDLNISTFVSIFDAVVALGVGIAVFIQAVLCIQTSTERNMCCKSILKEDQRYTVIDGKDTCAATNPASSRVSQPSYTNFAIPYTGGFTQITTSVNTDGESERRPLIESD